MTHDELRMIYPEAHCEHEDEPLHVKQKSTPQLAEHKLLVVSKKKLAEHEEHTLGDEHVSQLDILQSGIHVLVVLSKVASETQAVHVNVLDILLHDEHEDIPHKTHYPFVTTYNVSHILHVFVDEHDRQLDVLHVKQVLESDDGTRLLSHDVHTPEVVHVRQFVTPHEKQVFVLLSNPNPLRHESQILLEVHPAQLVILH